MLWQFSLSSESELPDMGTTYVGVLSDERTAYSLLRGNGETFLGTNIFIVYRNEVQFCVRFWNSLVLMTYTGGRDIYVWWFNVKMC